MSKIISKIIIDSSVLDCEPGQRHVDTLFTVKEFQELYIWSSLVDENFKTEILDWVKQAQVGDYKDFDIFSVFISR